jgi:hypothetical protein
VGLWSSFLNLFFVSKDERKKGAKNSGSDEAERLIRTLEETYFDLRSKNPDRDEHWLLANTWLKRYGASKQARQKGLKWTKFVAYKETLQFSILQSPKSIRTLALFLVYKELGEQQAIRYHLVYSSCCDGVAT